MTAWFSSVHCDVDVVILVCCYSHIFTCLAPDDSVLTEPELTEPGCVCAHVTPGLESRHHRHSLSLFTGKYFRQKEGRKIKLFWPNSGENFHEFLLGAFSRLNLFGGQIQYSVLLALNLPEYNGQWKPF